MKDAYQNNSGKSNPEILKNIRQQAQEMISTPNIFWHDKVEPERIVGLVLKEEYLKHHFSERAVINNPTFLEIIFPDNSNVLRSNNSNIRLSYWDIGRSYIGSKVNIKYKLKLNTNYGSQCNVEHTQELRNISLGDEQCDPLERLSIFLKENPRHNQFNYVDKEYKKIEDTLLKSIEEHVKNIFYPFVSKQFKRISPDRNI